MEPVKVGFKVPKMECEDGPEVPWEDCEDVEKEQMTTSMTCKVEYSTDCKPKVSEKCNAIEYMECNEIPTETCEPAIIKMPNQTYEHKKKCLLADLNADMQAALKSFPVDAPKGKQLTRDGVHMNKAGNIMMARGVAKAFGVTDEQLDESAKNWK